MLRFSLHCFWGCEIHSGSSEAGPGLVELPTALAMVVRLGVGVSLDGGCVENKAGLGRCERAIRKTNLSS